MPFTDGRNINFLFMNESEQAIKLYRNKMLTTQKENTN